ncbi:hypothetical protein D3C73_587140 [compost metagenome]
MKKLTEKQLDRWYKSKYGVSGKGVPSTQKLLAYMLVVGLPVSLAGCGSPAAEYPDSDLTARDACEWERQAGQTNLDCDDDTSSGNWYGSHGFSSSYIYISPSHSYYRSPAFKNNYNKYGTYRTISSAPEGTLKPSTSNRKGSITTRSGVGSSSKSSVSS